jgi:hypothetical protein
MAARKQGNQQVVDDLVLSDDALADLGTQGTPGLAQLACSGDIALDYLGRRLGGCLNGDNGTRRASRSFL